MEEIEQLKKQKAALESSFNEKSQIASDMKEIEQLKNKQQALDNSMTKFISNDNKFSSKHAAFAAGTNQKQLEHHLESESEMRARIEQESQDKFNEEEEFHDEAVRKAMEDYSVEEIPISITINSLPEFN